MALPLLATKLYLPPPRPGAVLRPRLIDRLNEGLAANHKLTLISAPAGFGKTTLVSQWVTGCGRPVAWLSLDEGDNDPTRFLTYLLAALQTVAPTLGAGLSNLLQSPEPPPTESMLTALLNEITALADPLLLVLDDYHLIDSKPIDAALTFLLEHLPPPMHLVIATREDPNLRLARYRARGQLTELRAADLRFTPAEAADFLNQVMGLNLSAENIAALETRTEGWIAGLQLAALSMQGHPDVAGFLRAFAGDNRFIVDYLVEEVLQSQPQVMRCFLLQTSLLEQLSGPLCDAVTASEGGSARLEALHRGNLFVIPLDDQRRWYRYHPLFADVLRLHLTAESPELVPDLHRRASQWYEQNGSMPDAIRHALAAKDYGRAADQIELAIPETRRNRRGATVTELGWLKALPDELVRFRPVLCVDYAYALFGGGELEAVEARLCDAERWLDPTADTTGMVVVDQEEFRRLPAMIAVLRGARALARGDVPETVRNARRALELAPKDAHLMIGGAASQLGLAAWTSGDLETAGRMTAEGMVHVRLAGYVSAAIGGARVLADIQLAQGRLHEAMATYEQALLWATPPGAPVVRGAADMHVEMSGLYYEHNDLAAAAEHLLTSQSLGELAGTPPYPGRWCAAMARLRQAEGDLDGALDLLDQAERLYEGAFAPNVRPIATRKVRVWLAQGRLDQALDWAHERGLSVDDELDYLREFDHLMLARVLLARHRREPAGGFVDGAVRLLLRLQQAAQEGGRNGSLIEILVLLALAHQAAEDLTAAMLPLQQALALAEPESYVRTFIDEGPAMRQLLAEAAARGIEPRYAARLLAAFDPEQRQAAPAPAPARGLIEPLSQRELEVLRLLEQGLSNREIAERLCVALCTVKGHNQNIFAKLQAKRRTEAVARARELGLL